VVNTVARREAVTDPDPVAAFCWRRLSLASIIAGVDYHRLSIS